MWRIIATTYAVSSHCRTISTQSSYLYNSLQSVVCKQQFPQRRCFFATWLETHGGWLTGRPGGSSPGVYAHYTPACDAPVPFNKPAIPVFDRFEVGGDFSWGFGLASTRSSVAARWKGLGTPGGKSGGLLIYNPWGLSRQCLTPRPNSCILALVQENPR